MPMSATKDKDGKCTRWWETRGGGEGGLKRLRPQRSEVADEMEVERRNKKISGGKEEEAAR